MARWHSYSFVFLIALAGSLCIPLPEDDFRGESVHSLRVVDRNGIVLREFLNDSEGRGQWKPVGEISPFLLEATIAIEDRRFRMHPGIDPPAIARAAWQNMRAGRLRSGASTITQQVIRNLYHHPRTIGFKLLEAWYALRLENMLSKDAILEHYVNRVPYGNSLIGAESASRHYFGKPARDLSLAEAAFLAGLPNAPSSLNPYNNLPGALERQRRVLGLMAEQGRISAEALSRALAQPVVLIPPEVNFRAPHIAEMARKAARIFPSAAVVHTTVDYGVQADIQWLIRGHLKQLRQKNVGNASVIVIDNATMEVRALVGSADYFDARIQGQVNGVLARRQPGSAVKPFLYALALEGPFTAADAIPDIPTSIPDEGGDYIPENYDRRYHGPVRLRQALACSYNVPAVRVLRVVGREHFLQRLLAAGLVSLDQPSSHYGYGLTLGNGEVTLLELAQAYAALANGGMLRPARLLGPIRMLDGSSPVLPPADSVRVFSEQVSWLISDILRDPDARGPAFGHSFRFPFDCAVKTGTTKDYRDNLTLGYTTRYTVGVWVGNFDGTPMQGVSGVTGAGQIFEDVMMLLHTAHEHTPPPPFPAPAGIVHLEVCSVSGSLPNEHCGNIMRESFLPDHTPADTCTVHRLFRIADGRGTVVFKVFDVLPDEYREWAADRRLPVPPPEAMPVAQSVPPSRHLPLVLLAPQDGQMFKVDPVLRKEYQAIRVLARVPEAVDAVVLRVGDEEALPYASDGTWWHLRKGTHRFVLEGRRNGSWLSSEPVTITVD